MRRAAVVLIVALGISGCGNATDFLRTPKKQKPVAVIAAPPGPLGALSAYVADGSASHDPDGHVVAWHWKISAKPSGSIMPLVPDASTGATATYTPDLLGHYELELVVTDDDGLDSDPALYDFDATDLSGLRVELTWDRDYVDVDLHLVDESAGGSFFTSPYDCYFQNKTPDWGATLDSADDPVLPFDQDEGFGPEVIGIRAPAAGTYRALAHYYCDDGFGGTTATIKLFSHGVEQAEAQATLVHTGDLWDVASVVVATDGTATLTISTSGVGTSTHGCG